MNRRQALSGILGGLMGGVVAPFLPAPVPKVKPFLRKVSLQSGIGSMGGYTFPEKFVKELMRCMDYGIVSPNEVRRSLRPDCNPIPASSGSLVP